MIHIKITQIEIDMQTLAYMHFVECSNEPCHEACAYNKCRACIGLEDDD